MIFKKLAPKSTDRFLRKFLSLVQSPRMSLAQFCTILFEEAIKQAGFVTFHKEFCWPPPIRATSICFRGHQQALRFSRELTP
jgi:hypothetical protein